MRIRVIFEVNNEEELATLLEDIKRSISFKVEKIQKQEDLSKGFEKI